MSKIEISKQTLKTSSATRNLNGQPLLPVLLLENVLRLVCRGGAKAFRLPDQIGSLEVGKKADVVLVDLNSPFAMPVHKVPSALVYNLNAQQVDPIIVNGKV